MISCLVLIWPSSTTQESIHVDPALDTAEVLQFTWLLARAHPLRASISGHVAAVKIPTVENLRRAGMNNPRALTLEFGISEAALQQGLEFSDSVIKLLKFSILLQIV